MRNFRKNDMSRSSPDNKRQPHAYGFEHTPEEIVKTLLGITAQLQELCSQYSPRSLQQESVRTRTLSELDAWFSQAVPLHRDNPRTPYELAAAIAYHTIAAKVKRSGLDQTTPLNQQSWHGSERAEKDMHLVQAQQLLTSFMLQESHSDVRATINLWYGALFELPWDRLTPANVERIRRLQWRDKKEELRVWTICAGVAAQVALFTALQDIMGQEMFQTSVSFPHPYFDVAGKIDVLINTENASKKPNIGIQLKSNARLPAQHSVRASMYFHESEILESGVEGDALRKALQALNNPHGAVIKLELRLFPQHNPEIANSGLEVINSKQAVFDGLSGVPSQSLVQALEVWWAQVLQQLSGK